MGDNYFEIILEDKIFTQRTPNSKFVEFTLDGIKVNTYEELPSDIKEIIEFNKKVEENPLEFFDIQDLTGGGIAIDQIRNHKDIKKYIKIPEYINGKPVTKINSDVVSIPDLRKKLTQIQLPETLKHIEPAAFRHLSNLKHINIPNNITRLPNLTFEGCASLMNLYLNNVTELGLGVFCNCRNLTKIDLSKVTEIDEQPFSYCDSLKEVILSDELTYIPTDMFYSCKGLEKINIPQKVTTILDSAFKNCESLREVIFPEKLKTISRDAFENCKSLKEFIAPPKLDYVGINAFRNSGLEILKMNKDGFIADYAFEECFKLKTIELYSNTKYKDNSFSYANKLKINFLPVEGYIPGTLII